MVFQEASRARRRAPRPQGPPIVVDDDVFVEMQRAAVNLCRNLGASRERIESRAGAAGRAHHSPAAARPVSSLGQDRADRLPVEPKGAPRRPRRSCAPRAAALRRRRRRPPAPPPPTPTAARPPPPAARRPPLATRRPPLAACRPPPAARCCRRRCPTPRASLPPAGVGLLLSHRRRRRARVRRLSVRPHLRQRADAL